MMRQLVPQEACLNCLGCCRFLKPDSCWSPLLLEEEAQGLTQKRLLKENFRDNYKIPLVPVTTEKKNFLCLFFDPVSNKCRIYPFRPFECQLYPFLINRKEKEIFLSVDLNCPFVKERYNAAEFKEYAGYLAELLGSPRYEALLGNNPQIAQRYEGVLDLALLKSAL